MTIKTATTDGVVMQSGEPFKIGERTLIVAQNGQDYFVIDYKSGMTASSYHSTKEEAKREAINNFKNVPEHQITAKIMSALKFYGLEYPLNK